MSNIISFTYKFVIHPNVLRNNLNGESVLLHLDSKTIFGLDEISNDFFEKITESDTVQGAYLKILEEYDVDPKRLKNDIRQFLTELLNNNLILIQNTET